MTPRPSFHEHRPWWAVALSATVTLLTLALIHHLDALYFSTTTSTVHVLLAGGNAFEVADWICMEGLDLLTNKMQVASLFSTDWQPEFEREFPVGDTVRVPLPRRGVIRQGMGYSGAPVVSKHTTVTADQVFGMDFDIESVEQALRVGRSKDYVSKTIIEPYMNQIAQEWDLRAARFVALNTPNITGVLGTDPTSFAGTTTVSRQIMAELGGMAGTTVDDRGVFLPPSVFTNLRANLAAAFNPVTDITKAFHEGLYGKADNFLMYESMSLNAFTSGTWASPTGLTVKTASVSGDTTLVVNCTTGDQFNQGDVLQVTGRFRVNPVTRQKVGARQLTMVVTAPTTGAASAATLPISIGPFGILGPGDPYQNVDSLPAVNDVVTMFPGTTITAATALTGNQGIAFSKNAFLLVGIPLRVPKSCETKAMKRDPNTGIAVRLTETWDAQLSRFITRLDTVGGFGVGWSDARSVRILCA